MKNISHFICLIIFGTACNIGGLEFDHVKGPTFEGIVAVPLADLHLTATELVKRADDGLEISLHDSTSLLQMVYRDTSRFAEVEKIVKIGDVFNTAEIRLPATSPSDHSQTVLVKDTLLFTYQAEKGERLDSLFHKAGWLTVSMSKSFPHELLYNVTLRNTRAESNDMPAVLDHISHSLDLAGYKTILFSKNDSNRFTANIELMVLLEPGQKLTADEVVQLQIGFIDQSFDVIYGSFGQDTLQISNKVMDLTFFKGLEEGLKLASPSLSFQFKNLFGLPMEIDLNEIYGARGDNATVDTMHLKGDLATNSRTLHGAKKPSHPAKTLVTLNNKNSSLKELLVFSPEKIGFDITAISNPLAEYPSNFVADKSHLLTIIEMLVPLDISMDDLVKEVAFDNISKLQFDQSDSLIVRIVAENKLPFSSSMVLEVMDDRDSVLYTIGEKTVLKVPQLNREGLVIEASRSVTDFVVPKEGILALNEGEKLNLKLSMNTAGNSGEHSNYVKIMADYTIDIQVSAIGKLKYPIP